MNFRCLILSLSLVPSALLGCWTGEAAAQEREPNDTRIALDKAGLNEILREGAFVSGSVVNGVLVRGMASSQISLSGYIPKEWAGVGFCARLRSIDGLYEARGYYNVPSDWVGGIDNLSFPTSYAEKLTAAPANGLAVRLTLGSCDKSEGGETSIALWNASNVDHVDLLLNSFRADDVFVYMGDGKPTRCEAIDYPLRTAFDTKCTLDLQGLYDEVDLEIYRVVGGKPAPPDTLKLRLPEQ